MNIRQIKKLNGPELLGNVHSIERNRKQRTDVFRCGSQGSTNTFVHHEVWIRTCGETWEEDMHTIAALFREAGQHVEITRDNDIFHIDQG